MALSSTSYRSKWKCGHTKLIRVPDALADEVLRYAHDLDSQGTAELLREPATAYRTVENIERTRPVNVASVPQRSPFRYPGGKTWLVPYIRSWLVAKKTVTSILVEPFAGGGIVGLTAAFEGLAEHVVLVERDQNVAAVWQTILGGQAEWLADRILNFELTPEKVVRTLRAEPVTQRERAFAVILRNRVQRGGIMAPGAGLVKSGENGKGLHSRWYPETLARRIQEIATIRERITFIEGDAFDVIRRYSDEENAAYFVDPPYTVAARRLYDHWQVDHARLFKDLVKARGDVLMTYDNTVEIAAMARTTSFEMESVSMKNTHHARMTELLIGKDFSWLRSAADGCESLPRNGQGTLAFHQ